MVPGPIPYPLVPRSAKQKYSISVKKTKIAYISLRVSVAADRYLDDLSGSQIFHLLAKSKCSAAVVSKLKKISQVIRTAENWCCYIRLWSCMENPFLATSYGRKIRFDQKPCLQWGHLIVLSQKKIRLVLHIQAQLASRENMGLELYNASAQSNGQASSKLFDQRNLCTKGRRKITDFQYGTVFWNCSTLLS